MEDPGRVTINIVMNAMLKLVAISHTYLLASNCYIMQPILSTKWNSLR